MPVPLRPDAAMPLFREPATRIHEPLVLADGQRLHPLGPTTSPAGLPVWVWSGERLTVVAGPEDLPDLFCLVVSHDRRRPTSRERRQVREVFGLERVLRQPVSLIPPSNRHTTYVLGRRPR